MFSPSIRCAIEFSGMFLWSLASSSVGIRSRLADWDDEEYELSQVFLIGMLKVVLVKLARKSIELFDFLVKLACRRWVDTLLYYLNIFVYRCY
ncbi:hypothetical protein DSO57_1002285 [Entomophthora muscae]|uniref:Uncharacterized protein n=1 Tax=Entomophthora muscae TaxID=34485 RepID=A0ACC2TJK0_9FUNG|nr:hypothetical protein DSO57_1002285 [Entomophthora muscae]